MGTFELFRDRRSEYRWRLKAGNNRKIADSGEGYAKKSACEHGIELVRQGDNFELYQDKQGKFRWRLRAANGRIIADSIKGYGRRYNCKRAVATFTRLAPTAEIKDQTSPGATPKTEKLLTAAFTAERKDGNEPLMVSFDSTATDIPEDVAILFAWDFGDGDTGTGATIDHIYPAPGTFPVSLVVADDQGTTDTLIQTVIVGEATSRVLTMSSASLYAGSEPVQFGVEEDAINPGLAVVLHGRVVTDTGEPLVDVIISVRDHPEYGWTTSQSDGTFEMVVNGGTQLVVRCELPGQIGEEQQVDAPWQEFATVQEVVMVLEE
jgi:uncharacterized protein YegP (UPF0339 family)